MAGENGWIKLHRELLDKPIWTLSTPEQKAILVTLLLMVNHAENEWEWNGKRVVCRPGQRVTSLDQIAKTAGKGISIQNVRTALNRFERYEFLTNESTKNGRLITICNWDTYQQNENNTNKEDNKELTKASQRANKGLTINNNDKKDKKENNDKKEDIQLSEKEKEFNRFNDWIDNNAKYIRKIRDQITFQEYCRLTERYNGEQIRKVLMDISNYKDAPKRYVSVNLTFQNWAKREFKNG
mgnify:CR=1 FL=1|jgi:hypothetical protein